MHMFHSSRASLRRHLFGLVKFTPKNLPQLHQKLRKSQVPLDGGGVQTRGLPDLDFFVLVCPFGDFPEFSGIFRIFSGIFPIGPFLSLSLLVLGNPPTRSSPERVGDTIRNFPETMGNPPVWKPAGLPFLQDKFLGIPF